MSLFEYADFFEAVLLFLKRCFISKREGLRSLVGRTIWVVVNDTLKAFVSTLSSDEFMAVGRRKNSGSLPFYHRYIYV